MTNISSQNNIRSGGLVGRFAVKAFLLCGAVGGVMILVGYGVFLLNYVLELADKTRNTLGYRAIPGQIDVMGISVIGVFIFVPVLVMFICYLKYQAAWRKKVANIWGDKYLIKKHSKLFSLSDPGTACKQAQYLDDLAKTATWKAELLNAGISDADSKELVAETILKSIEKDIAERAISTGLIVGISSSRLIDHITVVITALEIQLHVLSKLGRKPSLKTWYELLVRAGSSLFVNDYLNRSDALSLTMTTKAIAAGMSLTSGLLESDAIDDVSEDLFEHAENFLNRFATGDVSGAIINSVLVTSELAVGGALSIGSEGLQLMSQLVEKHGDDLLQGVFSGGMLYYQGMAIAADSLSTDHQHRQASNMSRTPYACMNAIAQSAGNILLTYIRDRKDCIRKKKRTALNKVPGVKSVIEKFSQMKRWASKEPPQKPEVKTNPEKGHVTNDKKPKRWLFWKR